MSNYRAYYRQEIEDFLSKFPPGTPVITRTLKLDRVKPGFRHDERHKPFPHWKFEIWWEESVRAIDRLRKSMHHV
jgi:hypothetical protein